MVLVVKEPSRTRSNDFKVDKFRFKKDISKNWFTSKIVDEWNKLGSHVLGAYTKQIG